MIATKFRLLKKILQMIQGHMEVVRSLYEPGSSVEHEEAGALGVDQIFSRRWEPQGKGARDVRRGD